MDPRVAKTLLLLLFGCILVSGALSAAEKPIKRSEKNDFEMLTAKQLELPGRELWLCPYAYSPVPLEASDPQLKRVLANLTQRFDSQFNYSKYGT